MAQQIADLSAIKTNTPAHVNCLTNPKVVFGNILLYRHALTLTFTIRLLAFHFVSLPSPLNELNGTVNRLLYAECEIAKGKKSHQTAALFFNFGDVLTAEWFL